MAYEQAQTKEQARGRAGKRMRGKLSAEGLHFSYDGVTEVIRGVDFVPEAGKITALMGANGCGKSTLFGLLSRTLTPDEGIVRVDGEDADLLSRREFARKVAIVHQNNTAPPDVTVERLVSYGRTPYFGAFQSAGSRADREAVRWAMQVTGVDALAKRAVSALSGGQRQRVWIAMALAQRTPTLLLDEPTSALDIRYQVEIMQLIRDLNRSCGMTILMVLHDLNQAMRYADVFAGMKDGRIVVQGDPRTVVTEDVIETLYGIRLPVLDAGGIRCVLAV